MFLPLVRGQEPAKRHFQRAIEAGRLSHAYLFAGPPGSGKSLFARELAKTLFCREGAPCGACPSCLQVEHGNHPSVHVYGPAEGKSVVDIDTVRSLCERTHYRTSQVLVSILERADLLNEPASNALLKTLEEPPGDALLILTSQSAGSLLSTIVSRCHRILFTGTVPETPRLAGEALELIEAVRRPGFHARNEPRAWLSRLVPEEEGARGALRRLLSALVEKQRSELPGETGTALDDRLRRAGALLDLGRDLERNVHADLILERLLRVIGAP